MELHEALGDISAMRRQLARSETFRGYRALPVAGSGLLAFAAGFAQPWVVARPAEQLDLFLMLWTGVAAISVILCFGDVWRRYRAAPGLLQRETTQLAVGQFLPCVAAGGALTAVLAVTAPHLGWLLPGLWAVLFSLGLFASWRWLPRLTGLVAAYYLLAGLASLAAGERLALSPLTMPLLFGIGQCLAATALWLSERPETEAAR